MAKKKQSGTPEELLEQALVPESEQPYDVPENWVWVRFGELATDIADGPFGSNLKREHYTEKKEVRIIQLSNIGDEGWRDDNVRYTTFEHLKTIMRSRVHPNEIVIAKMMPAGRAIIVPDLESAYVLSSDAMKFVPHNRVNVKYLLYAINSNDFRNQISSETQGITRARTSIGKMRAYAFPLPPLAEQQRIVDRIESLFEKLDQAKGLIQDALDTFENRKAAILHKAFSGELTRKWREENGVGMESWEEKRLSETDIQIIDGDRGVNYPKKEEFNETGYCLFLNAKNVTRNGFVFKELQFITDEKDKALRKGKLKRHDIILTTRGTVGNIAYYNDEIPFDNMRINSGMVILRGGGHFYKPFLCWIFKAGLLKDQISAIKTGSAQPQLPITIMKTLKLIVPSLIEQVEIVRLLEDIINRDNEAERLCGMTSDIDLMKKAILARAFRGELGTNDSDEESALVLLKEVLGKLN